MKMSPTLLFLGCFILPNIGLLHLMIVSAARCSCNVSLKICRRLNKDMEMGIGLIGISAPFEVEVQNPQQSNIMFQY